MMRFLYSQVRAVGPDLISIQQVKGRPDKHRRVYFWSHVTAVENLYP